MLIEELGQSVDIPIAIHVDSLNAKKYQEDNTARSKFIDVYYKLVKERVDIGDI